MPTPHNSANKGDFAKTVLMPGDPLRAKYIAETFLENPVLVNNVRGVQGYTGLWKGARVSVMASGMGIPSIGIYSWELYNQYDVENIIRVGSAGGISDELQLRDVVCALGACTDSNFAHQFGLKGSFAPIADWTLLKTAAKCAAARGIEVKGRQRHEQRQLLQRRERRPRPVEEDGRPRRGDGGRGPLHEPPPAAARGRSASAP